MVVSTPLLPFRINHFFFFFFIGELLSGALPYCWINHCCSGFPVCSGILMSGPLIFILQLWNLSDHSPVPFTYPRTNQTFDCLKRPCHKYVRQLNTKHLSVKYYCYSLKFTNCNHLCIKKSIGICVIVLAWPWKTGHKAGAGKWAAFPISRQVLHAGPSFAWGRVYEVCFTAQCTLMSDKICAS